MLINLLTLGAACALGAFLISLRMSDRGRTRRAGALFVTMLALLLAEMYPAWFPVFGAVGIVAAFVYAISAMRQLRGQSDDDGPGRM